MDGVPIDLSPMPVVDTRQALTAPVAPPGTKSGGYRSIMKQRYTAMIYRVKFVGAGARSRLSPTLAAHSLYTHGTETGPLAIGLLKPKHRQNPLRMHSLVGHQVICCTCPVRSARCGAGAPPGAALEARGRR
jgi:hypothetical protein